MKKHLQPSHRLRSTHECPATGRTWMSVSAQLRTLKDYANPSRLIALAQQDQPGRPLLPGNHASPVASRSDGLNWLSWLT